MRPDSIIGSGRGGNGPRNGIRPRGWRRYRGDRDQGRARRYRHGNACYRADPIAHPVAGHAAGRRPRGRRGPAAHRRGRPDRPGYAGGGAGRHRGDRFAHRPHVDRRQRRELLLEGDRAAGLGAERRRRGGNRRSPLRGRAGPGRRRRHADPRDRHRQRPVHRRDAGPELRAGAPAAARRRGRAVGGGVGPRARPGVLGGIRPASAGVSRSGSARAVAAADHHRRRYQQRRGQVPAPDRAADADRPGPPAQPLRNHRRRHVRTSGVAAAFHLNSPHTDAGAAVTTTTTHDADAVAINTIRALCMDAIQKANSGHPGTPIGVAPVAYTLWQRFLRFDPGDPIWPNRDRFVLSSGHASTLLWSLLHLAGVQAVDPDYEVLNRAAVTLDDLKTFRQLGSRCPGHPEYRWTSGVETTTGPLGQGLATSVGMAIAARWLGSHFNRDEFTMFDFDVYAMAGDGCMMEGVSAEAASLAAHLRLANLCWIYDSNRVTIEGHTDIAFTEDVAARFIAYGWNITTVADANDVDSISRA